jgi:hypothetical protein
MQEHEEPKRNATQRKTTKYIKQEDTRRALSPGHEMKSLEVDNSKNSLFSKTFRSDSLQMTCVYSVSVSCF